MSREKNVVIAVIDSGIDASIADLGNHVIKSTAYRVNSEGYIGEFSDLKSSNMHGTCVSLVIRDACNAVDLIDINILNEKLSTDSRIMMYAMYEAIKFHPDIIHMSLGTTKKQYSTDIEEVVVAANEKGIVVVSACNNMGFKSYPACLDGVVGVKTVKHRLPIGGLFYKKGRYYHAPSNMCGIRGMEELEGKGMFGTSISAAYMTGYIANVIYHENIRGYHEVMERLALGLNQNKNK